MALISPQWARARVRSYPFKMGQSALKKFYSRLFSRDEPFSIVTVEGLRLQLSNYGNHKRMFWWFEEIEPALQLYIRSFLPTGGTVVDVGANSGLMGLLAARLKSAEVKLVEASPVLVKTLEQTLRLNPEIASLCQLYAQPCALGPFDPRYKDQPGITLEKIIDAAGWNHVDLLKVDIDGPDFEVLSSAGRYLRPEFIQAIYIETEAALPEKIIEVAARGYAAYATRRTHLPDLRRLGVNQTERTHYETLNLEALTPKNVPANVLFLNAVSRVNEHMRRWCG